jgi:hypothetical protein
MDKGMFVASLEAAGLVLVVFGIPVWLMWRHERKRTERLRAIATSLGATFQPKGTDQEMAALLAQSHVGSHGDTRRLTNLIEIAGTGDLNIKLFDYYYCTSTGRSSIVDEQTVVRIESPKLNLSELLLHPTSFLSHKIGKAFGAQEINFPNFPEFSKMFTVQGADEPEVRRIFTPAVIQYCQGKPSNIIEGCGNRLLVYRSNKRIIKPDAITAFLDEGKQIASLIIGARASAA